VAIKTQLETKRNTSEKSPKKKLIVDRINAITTDFRRLIRQKTSSLKDNIIEIFIKKTAKSLFTISRNRRRRRSTMTGIKKKVLKSKPKSKRQK